MTERDGNSKTKSTESDAARQRKQQQHYESQGKGKPLANAQVELREILLNHRERLAVKLCAPGAPQQVVAWLCAKNAQILGESATVTETKTHTCLLSGTKDASPVTLFV